MGAAEARGSILGTEQSGELREKNAYRYQRVNHKKEQQNLSLEIYFLYLQDLYIISITTDI